MVHELRIGGNRASSRRFDLPHTGPIFPLFAYAKNSLLVTGSRDARIASACFLMTTLTMIAAAQGDGSADHSHLCVARLLDRCPLMGRNWTVCAWAAHHHFAVKSRLAYVLKASLNVLNSWCGSENCGKKGHSLRFVPRYAWAVPGRPRVLRSAVPKPSHRSVSAVPGYRVAMSHKPEH